jgi:hypothetical protein
MRGIRVDGTKVREQEIRGSSEADPLRKSVAKALVLRFVAHGPAQHGRLCSASCQPLRLVAPQQGRQDREQPRMRAEASDPPRAGNGIRVRGRAGLADVVGLVLALEARQSLLPSERRVQDRSFAGELEGLTGARLLRHWLARSTTPALVLRVRRVTRAFAGIRIGFTVGGALLGWSAAAALLSIRGPQGRISLAACLAILVGLPFLGWLTTVVLWLIAGLLPTAAGPGERGSLARGLHRLVLRLLPAATRLDVEAIFGRARAHGALFARLQRGQWTSWLLQAGISYGLAALAATLVFVVFTDLAFGWSTTLDVAPERVHRLVAALAWPWAAIWPEASPSLELVEATRHFRVAEAARATGAAGGPSPLVYGAWWPFLVMAIACYAILPRLATLPLLGLWLGRESERVLRLMPGALELVESLSTPWVESGGEGCAGPVGRAMGGMVPEVELAGFLARDGGAGSAFAVVWAEALDEAALRASLGVALRVVPAGGRRRFEEDAEAVRAAAGAGGAMLVAVHGHEPPVLEQLDFLAALRRAAGAERALAVVLVGGGDRDLETWRRKLVELADPRLAVARLGPAGGRGSR